MAIKNVASTPLAISSPQQSLRTVPMRPQRETSARFTIPSPETASAPALTDEEQQFFEHLFPESIADIRVQAGYYRDGKRTAAPVLGTLVDRRG